MQYGTFSLVSHIFTSYFIRPKACEINRRDMKNSKNSCHIALDTVQYASKSVEWNLSDGRNSHEHSTFINPSNSAF